MGRIGSMMWNSQRIKKKFKNNNKTNKRSVRYDGMLWGVLRIGSEHTCVCASHGIDDPHMCNSSSHTSPGGEHVVYKPVNKETRDRILVRG